jgi:hypothetical protein
MIIVMTSKLNLVWRSVGLALLLGSITSCGANRSDSALKYDLSKPDCTKIKTRAVKQSCLEAATYKFENLPRIKARIEQFGPEFVEYNAAYYEDFPSSLKGHLRVEAAVEFAARHQVILSGDIHSVEPVAAKHLKILELLISHVGAEALVCATEMDDLAQTDIDLFRSGHLTKTHMTEVVELRAALSPEHWFRYFELCQKYRIPFHAVDIDQSSDPSMKERDKLIFLNIKKLAAKYPLRKIFSPYGILHLNGEGKLPDLLSNAGVSSFQFHEMVTDRLHWQCADDLGSESRANTTACVIDASNVYLFSGLSLLERMREVWFL